MARKSVFAVYIAIILILLMGVTAFADVISEKQNQYDQIQNNLDRAYDKYNDLEDEVQAGQKQIQMMDANIQKTNEEIKAMNLKISAVQSKIDLATKKLNDAIDDYNRQDELMKKRINALYKNDLSYGYLEVILESTSFSDLISRADIMKKVLNYDINLLKDMKQKREEIDKKKAELEQDKAELVAVKSNIENKKKDLEKQKQDRKDLVAKVSRQMAQIKSYIEQEEATAKKLENEIKALLSSKSSYDGSKYAIIKRSDFPNGRQPRISSGFGYRVDPITGKKGAYHSGIDISTNGVVNIPVYAMAPGKVIIAQWYGGYGYAVVIDHGSGLSTLYGHNNTLLVKVGDNVLGGQKIALSGSTGRSTGPHVHFGVMKNGEYIDPSPYLLIGN